MNARGARCRQRVFKTTARQLSAARPQQHTGCRCTAMPSHCSVCYFTGKEHILLGGAQRNKRHVGRAQGKQTKA